MTEVTNVYAFHHIKWCTLSLMILTLSTDVHNEDSVKIGTPRSFSMAGQLTLNLHWEGESMKRTPRNFRMNIMLLVLLGLTAIFLIDMVASPQTFHPGIGMHLHALCGFTMTCMTFIHILRHYMWFKGALKGKVKGRKLISLGMNTMVFILMVLASISGFDAMEAQGISLLHAVTGSGAVLGLAIHCVKHMNHMKRTLPVKIHKTYSTVQTVQGNCE